MEKRRKEKEEKRKEKEKPKKGSKIEVRKVAEEWEIWNKKKEAVKSEKEVKEKFYK